MTTVVLVNELPGSCILVDKVMTIAIMLQNLIVLYFGRLIEDFLLEFNKSWTASSMQRLYQNIAIS